MDHENTRKILYIIYTHFSGLAKAGNKFNNMERERFIYQKPEQPKLSEPQEKLEKMFELKKQYQEQVKALLETQVIEILPESSDKAGKGVLGMYDINNNECPIPSYEDILKRMEKNAEFLAKKREQGFTELLLVPIGTPLSFLIDRIRDLIVKKHKQGKLLGTDGKKLELNENEPVCVNDIYKDADKTGDLVYYPQKFDKEDHGGKTKEELIAETGGWQIELIEDMPDLPAEGKGKTFAGRKQIEANQSPEEYLETQQTNKQYEGEQFTTPESQLSYFMQYLQKHNQVIDDWQGQGKTCWNAGAYFKGSGLVPDGDWNRSAKQFYLHRNRPDARGGNDAARSSVII